jgi:hypothetical protein
LKKTQSEEALVYFFRLVTGPSRPESEDQQMRVSIGDKLWQVNVSGALSLEVPLNPGLDFLDIARQDSPAFAAQPDRDPRALPVGLWN